MRNADVLPTFGYVIRIYGLPHPEGGKSRPKNLGKWDIQTLTLQESGIFVLNFLCEEEIWAKDFKERGIFDTKNFGKWDIGNPVTPPIISVSE